MIAVLDGTHTVAILPTGGGKSAAFEVPPVLDGRLTIVVVPFRAVISQVLHNAEHRGIKAERWTTATARELHRTRLAVVAVETVITQSFLE